MVSVIEGDMTRAHRRRAAWVSSMGRKGRSGHPPSLNPSTGQRSRHCRTTCLLPALAKTHDENGPRLHVACAKMAMHRRAAWRFWPPPQTTMIICFAGQTRAHNAMIPRTSKSPCCRMSRAAAKRGANLFVQS